ncbi:hypothetical protein SSTU70S_05824 [Stutzerimonas stutzeri]
MRSLKNSLLIAPAATALAVVLGTLAAVGLTRAEFRGKALLMTVLISPMVVPVVIIGVASYLFFAPLGMGNSYLSLILVHAVLGVPFVMITVSATLQAELQPGARRGQPGRLAADRVLPRDPAADRAGGDLRCAVCLRHLVR